MTEPLEVGIHTDEDGNVTIVPPTMIVVAAAPAPGGDE